MRKQNDKSTQTKRLAMRVIYAAMSAALLAIWPLTVYAEESVAEEVAEDLNDYMPEEEAYLEDMDLMAASEELAEDEDFILEDEQSIEEIIVIPEETANSAAEAEPAEGTEDAGAEEETLFLDENEQEAVEPETFSGECGMKEGTVFWELDADGVLHIFGKGAMKNWAAKEEVPWFAYAQKVTEVEVEEGVTAIGSYAFSACRLKCARIG